MDKNIFICYARKDLDIIKGFLYDLNEEALHYPFKINALIDKSRRVLSAGDRSKEKLQEHIRNSDGAVVFISNNFAESEFIKEHEIPEILAKKKLEPDYIITPIFIDKNVEVSKEILSFQSPNTEEEEIRILTPGLRELIYKKNIKEIYEYFTEVEVQNKHIADEPEDQRVYEDGQELLQISEIRTSQKWFNKYKSLRNIVIIFTLGILVSVLGTPFTSNLQEESLDVSCGVFENHYSDIENLYDNSFIGTFNKSINTWNSYLNFYDSEEYRNYTAEEQKIYHEQNGLYEFRDDLKQLNEIIIKIEVQGIEDVAEEHVELKRLLLDTQELAILNTQNGIDIVKTYIEYIDNIEDYFQNWDDALPEEEDSIIEKFENTDLQLVEERKILMKNGEQLDKDLTNILLNYSTKMNEICILEG
jgi:hypothetical protein